jgi:hypothetical protein
MLAVINGSVALPLRRHVITAAAICTCAGSVLALQHQILPLPTALDATVYASTPVPAQRQGQAFALPSAPPLSLGGPSQQLPQHQVLASVRLCSPLTAWQAVLHCAG